MTDSGDIALARIEAHEKLCSERYEGIQYGVRRMERILWTVAGSLILQLLAACSYLLIHTK